MGPAARSLRQEDLDLSLEDHVEAVGRAALGQDQVLRLARQELGRRQHRIQIGSGQALEDHRAGQDRAIAIEIWHGPRFLSRGGPTKAGQLTSGVTSSKTTSTRMPIVISAFGTFTRFAVSRGPSSSCTCTTL